MARAVWCALAFATLATGARYIDYSDVKMPDYGSAIDYDGPRDSPANSAVETDDYHEPTQEAPPPSEYKYEEDRGKADKHTKEVGETGEWQSSVKKHKKYLDNENQENFETFSAEETSSNFKTNHKPSKHRPRLKTKSLHNEDSALRNKHPIRHSRNRKKDMSAIESKENFDETVDDFEDDKDIDFEEDQIKVRNNYKETTVRTARRKPRDRFVKSEAISDEEDPIMNIRRRPAKDETRLGDNAHVRSGMKRQPYRQSSDARMKAGIGADRGRLAHKNYDEYAEFYDMKRVQDIKDKLFKENLQVRRTTTMRSPMRTKVSPRFRLRGGGTNGLEGLRRVMNPVVYDYRSPRDDDYPETESEIPINIDGRILTTMEPPAVEPQTLISEMLSPATTVMTSMMTTTTKETTTTTEATTTKNATTTTEATTTIEEEEEEEIEIPMNKTKPQMSLAERSRLSIIKKAMRKEMVKGALTKKPPVLLQVTHGLHTLVMVEPATSMQPWQHVSVVQDDTPDNVFRVKRLMRKKLVENAKNIHDLSENWDDMVCDYIDMSLLERKAAASVCTLQMSLMLFTLLIIVLL